jgi:hypothetical protein
VTDLLKHSYRALKKTDGTILKIQGSFYPDAIPNYLNLSRLRGELYTSIGFRVPKFMQLVIKLIGLSPGEVKLWFDAECGFFTEARAYTGAPPVYHIVTDEVAIAIVKGELTHELEAVLMTPDEYMGE